MEQFCFHGLETQVMRHIKERAGTKASVFRSSHQKITLICGTRFDVFLTRTTFKN